MRAFSEIIEDALSGGMPSHEECYWAMLALQSASVLDKSTLYRELLKDPPTALPFRKLMAENSHTMWKALSAKSPKEWLGPDHDPSRPEVQQRREMSLRIWKKFEDQATKNE